jgi:hypothetical protein
LYWWNVTGYINNSIYATSETRNFTVTAGPPWLNVTLNQPADGSTVPSNVTLNYTITGSNSTYNTSLNLNGSANYQFDVGKMNNTLYNFTLSNLNPGVYWWNVTGYIDNSTYNTSETRNFTVTATGTPPAVWIT